MTAAIEVPDVRVHVATAEASGDPHGQGFAAAWAEFEVSDPALTERLVRVARERTSVTVRCAMIDVIGSITKTEQGGKSVRFVLSVDDMVYRKPTGPRISVRSRPARA